MTYENKSKRIAIRIKHLTVRLLDGTWVVQSPNGDIVEEFTRKDAAIRYATSTRPSSS